MPLPDAEAAPPAAPPARQGPRLTTKTLFVIGAMNMIDCINVNLLTPYVDEMVSGFLDLPPEDPHVGHVVGLLIGLYSLFEVIFSVVWGAVADSFGRKPALLIGLGGSVIAPIMFGLGKSLPAVFLARALDGFFCGNVGVARTYLGEVCDSSNEAQAFSSLSLFFSLGLFIGPILGGQLSHPVHFAPSVFGGTIFDTHPYLLPNLTYAVFAAIAWVIGALFLEESLPREARRPCCKRRSRRSAVSNGAGGMVVEDEEDSSRRMRRQLSNTWTGTDPGGAPRSYPMERGESEGDSVTRRQCYPKALLQVGSVYCILSGTVAANSQLFVLIVSYPASKGGFGFGPRQIGAVQNAAACGLLLTQQLIYPRVVKRLGLYRTFVTGWTLYVTVWALFPFYSMFADTDLFGLAPRFVALSFLMAVSACACGMLFPTSFVFINRASEGLDKGLVNGWSVSTGALCRALWPPITAWVLGVGANSGLPDGTFLAVHMSLLLSTIGMIFCGKGLRAADQSGDRNPEDAQAAAAAVAVVKGEATATDFATAQAAAGLRPQREGAAPLIDG